MSQNKELIITLATLQSHLLNSRYASVALIEKN